MNRPITSEAAWQEHLARLDVPDFDPAGAERVVVVAAHPDDETLGASGCTQAMHANGADIALVVASDGEAAFPDAGPDERAELARRRRVELADALRVQCTPEIDVTWLGLPDSGLAEHEAELTERLAVLLRDADRVLLPWPHDPHPDHAAVARAALAATPVDAVRWSYPIWMWHWLPVDDPSIPWSRAARHRMPEQHRERKAAAIDTYHSQLTAGPRGEEPIVTVAMRAHFTRDTEVLFREPRTESAPVSRFASLYSAEPDPWRTATSWYERRKRATVLAALPRERYRVAVEPGCGTGELTAALRTRCEVVHAFDPVPAAVARAEAVSGLSVACAALPDGLPDVSADLVVCSEVLYYLGDADFESTVDELLRVLRRDGDLVAVHYRDWPPDAPRDAAHTHQALAARPELRTMVEHTDERFLLHVFRRA